MRIFEMPNAERTSEKNNIKHCRPPQTGEDGRRLRISQIRRV